MISAVFSMNDQVIECINHTYDKAYSYCEVLIGGFVEAVETFIGSIICIMIIPFIAHVILMILLILSGAPLWFILVYIAS